MPQIIFVMPDGSRRSVETRAGTSVMEAAVNNGVEGIEAECGGACSCATCHVHVDPAWAERTGAPSEMEEDMLDFAVDVDATSRLSCQIEMSDALDGLVVRVPRRQA